MKGEEKPYQNEPNSVQEVRKEKETKKAGREGVGGGESLIQCKADLKIPM